MDRSKSLDLQIKGKDKSWCKANLLTDKKGEEENLTEEVLEML